MDLERLHPGDAFFSSRDVQGALLNVLMVWVGPGRYCSPRHRMPFNSRNEESRCVE